MIAQPSTTALDLSIVIPAYNEEARIRPTLTEYLDHFSAAFKERFEVVVVLNGCVDNTRGVVEDISKSWPQVRIIEFPRPMGKGGAIGEGMDLARGDLIAFVDADNMVRAPEVAKLIRALDTHDVAIADRFTGSGSGGNQPLLRRAIGVASRQWVRRFLSLPFSDTQCGAKAFRAPAWRAVAPHVEERGWAFDLDVLAHVQRLSLSVAEVPVKWQHIHEGSKVQAWKDVPSTFLSTFRIKRRAR
jgi:dolichyl-phosphate beta-glucosyltransferase